ncbi:conjugal transfer mating pair stabilization protein TraG [Paraburkholderia fungorum]|uniref:conjugal transfer protein TraG N-terminal domain-containing protein n=1 Tax=Paraburkholderia fungorum TaxID=134537 RepID=UPI000D04A638|nr:conjugal transfer protein TraG N-terminal domain-containing protein [Paraburkholderia fungorum]PRZ44872.1 conjugal transfer mating pair stabilization protein TraG [Paraburkholderia fungorum]
MAIPTLTIYSVSADLTTLYSVLNGVAMICQQDLWIWGFAVGVAMWRLLASSTVAVLRSPSGQGGAVLGQGAFNTLMPFVLAMTLTNPMLKGTVQIESTINGAVTEVANVPLAISFIPAAGSLLSMNLNEEVSTAFGNVSSEYPAISATANGFLNPLKILLSSRTAMVRLGGIDSEVKTVLASCLGPDSGVNYANIENLVLNAGNTGATSSQSIAINGLNPTALGALLYQASLNTNGMVNDPGLSSTQLLSCSDAANQVANDITNALNSVEFTRVIQGAVNGMDQPIPGADYSFDTVAAQYSALTTVNTLGSIFAGGQGQANAEFMNLLFSEMVENDLNCLRASSDTLVECQATALQASEVERNNLQQAASEVPMLRYAGSFGNYLIALIIGLGPVIVMFMMFAGVEAGKCVKTVAHLIVWPLLVVNVGAELVNGMIAIDVANYLQSLRQGGWISQASALSAYKELSLQIGVGSHIMASLPVLMSLIFGLGESSALTSVATNIAPKAKETGDSLAPSPEVQRPLFDNGSVGTISQFGHGAGNLKFTGALDAASTSTSFGNMVRDASRTLTQADQQSQTISSGETNLADWREAMSTGNYSRIGIDQAIGESVAKEFRKSQASGTDQHTNTSVTGVRTNANESSAGFAAGIGGGTSSGEGGGPGIGFHLGANGQTTTSAQDALQNTENRGRSQNYNDSVALSEALSKTISKFQNTSAGRQANSELSRSLSTQQSYQQTLSEVRSTSDAAAQGVRESSSFIDASANIGANEIVWQQQRNPEYAAFQLTSGRMFDENPVTRQYIATAAADAASGATGRVVGDADGQAAVNRHRAAVMLAQDTQARPEDRLAAARYLADEGKAMQHMRFEPTDTAPLPMSISAPVDDTGVNARGLIRQSNARTPAPAVPAMRSATAVSAVAAGYPAAAHSQPSGASSIRHLAHAGPAPQLPAGNAPQLPAAPSPNFDLDPALEREVASRMAATQQHVANEVKGAEGVAHNAGLDASGHGTFIRTGANVADNALDSARPAGSSSRTRLGDTDAPQNKPASGKPETPHEQKSHFVRRGPG